MTEGGVSSAGLRDPRDAGVALFQRFPELVDRLPWAPLGDFPTEVAPLALDAAPGTPASPATEVWVKREDRSGGVYGGNKVRTIEGHIGRAIARGQTRIWASGAFGSNHALCTALHARRVGLEVGVSLFPQPPTATAQANLRATLSTRPAIANTPAVALMPVVVGGLMLGTRDAVMTPGGATPTGALGHVSAGLELAGQIAAGALPAPRRVVLAVGSTCTCAGLLVGLHLAASLGVAPAPELHGVGIGPWPVTSKAAILWLARRTAAHLEGLLGRRLGLDRRALAAGLVVHHDQLGKGYGFPTAAGADASERFASAGGPPLDAVYTAKSAAALLRLRGEGPSLYWATKSSRPLPTPTPDDLARAPAQMRRWLDRAALRAPDTARRLA